MATKRDLVAKAHQVAEHLVDAALEHFFIEAVQALPRGASMTIPGVGAVEIKALPPAPAQRRGRKPGPKPKVVKRRGPYKKRATPGAPAVSAAATPAAATSPGLTDDGIAKRKCRKCQTAGQTGRVPGTEKTVRCGACGFRWDIRLKLSERSGGAAAPGIVKAMRKPTAAPREACCTRCDHDRSAHEMHTGKCLVPRCVCAEFYE